MADLGGTEGLSLPSSAKTGKKPKTPKNDKKKKKMKKMKDGGGTALETDRRIRKKKKSKLREATRGKKDKKKRSRKERAEEPVGGPSPSLAPAVGGPSPSPAHPRAPWDEPWAGRAAGSHPNHWGGAIPDRSPSILQHQRVTKTKKRVAFDLGCSGGRPAVLLPPGMGFSPPAQGGGPVVQRPGDAEPQAASESQGASDEVNSQDLFITQKRFRPPVEQSSQETPQAPPGLHRAGMWEDGVPRLKDPPGPQDEDRPAEQAPPRTQMVGLELLGEQNQRVPSHLTPSRRPRPASPRALKRIPGARDPLATRRAPTAAASTQTENFFSTELSRYLRFCQRRRLSSRGRSAPALDLSLPQRTRSDPMGSAPAALGGGSAAGVRGGALPPGRRADRSAPPPGSAQGRGVKGRPGDAQCNPEATPSPQSEVEPKSSDATASSEDPEARARRADLMQVKAVQTRLNESFFFRAKGEGLSPRPDSPLMKLVQGREKSKRRR